jgi:hypothetical protein
MPGDNHSARVFIASATFSRSFVTPPAFECRRRRGVEEVSADTSDVSFRTVNVAGRTKSIRGIEIAITMAPAEKKSDRAKAPAKGGGKNRVFVSSRVCANHSVEERNLFFFFSSVFVVTLSNVEARNETGHRQDCNRDVRRTRAKRGCVSAGCD